MAGEALKWISEHVPSKTDECVLWPFGKLADGYGAVQVGPRKWRAHRFVCVQVHGPASPEYDAAHRCGVRACVNDRHLYWATRAKNLADRVEHGTANRGKRNGQAKLDEAQARAILAAKDSGRLQRDIASDYGVSRELVGRIWRKKIWTWL